MKQEREGVKKTQVIEPGVRVMIEFNGQRFGYSISVQEYAPRFPLHWEIRPDGWRDVLTQYSPTREGANRIFDDMVRMERRYAEQH